jgi:hypothetical protein
MIEGAKDVTTILAEARAEDAEIVEGRDREEAEIDPAQVRESIAEEYDDIPEESEDIDNFSLNAIAGVMSRIKANISALDEQADLEHQRITDRLAAKTANLRRDLEWVEKAYRPAFERSLAEAAAHGDKSVKLLNATISRTRTTYAGKFIADAEAEALRIVREAGADEIITPAKTIPECVGWGAFKKLLKFEIDNKTGKLQAILAATGEVVEIVEATQNGGELRIELSK